MPDATQNDRSLDFFRKEGRGGPNAAFRPGEVILAFGPSLAELQPIPMHEMKDTVRALVRIGYDGRVHKTFRNHQARERFENEVRVLQHLERRGCDFVPRLLEHYPDELRIVTTNCGSSVEHLGAERMKELFAELEPFGVRHEDQALRNITYRTTDGRFCVIDFELATLLEADPPSPATPREKAHRRPAKTAHAPK